MMHKGKIPTSINEKHEEEGKSYDAHRRQKYQEIEEENEVERTRPLYA